MSYIRDFLDYSMGICEAPEQYHRWVALWTLAAACGRRFKLPFHGNYIYPNMMLVLVGPAGSVQKSTVSGIGVELLREAGLDNIYTDRLTRAYLASELIQRSKNGHPADIVIYVPELRTALSEMTLREGIMETLTRLWDCPTDFGHFVLRHTKEKAGPPSVKNACLNFVGCSTRQWLITGLRPDEMGGGFSARTIYVYGDMPHTLMRYRPKAPKVAQKAHVRLVKHLDILCHTQGELRLIEEAADYWYEMRERLQQQNDIDERIADFVRRRHVHALKLASLLCLSELPTAREITLRNLQTALKYLETNEPSTLEALQGVGPSRLTTMADEVLGIIKAAGGELTRTQLTKTLNSKRMRMAPGQLDQLMASLEDADEIECLEEQRVPGKKKTIIYKLKR